MTKDANVKRAARARARQTGESYAKVRADMDREDLGLARRILGEEPVSIEQVLVSGRGYAAPYVHRVQTTRHLVYLKHGPASKTGGRYALEAWAYRACRSQDVMVPEVVDAAEPGAELDYIATIQLPGASLWTLMPETKEARRSVVQRAGEQIRAMHEIELEGYGPITSPGRGSHTKWCPQIELAITQYLPSLVECRAISAEEAQDIERRLGDAVAHIPTDAPSRLLHGDLEGDHLFSDGRKFTGLIDFGSMQAGDPIFDLARFAWWDAESLADLLDGYGHDRITDEDVQIRMPAYLIATATRIVGEVKRSGRTPEQAAEFIRIACAARFERSAGRVNATAPRPMSPQEILWNAVRGKTDEEIDAFAETVGGYGRLCGDLLGGVANMLGPKQDCTVGFILGDDLRWVVRSTDGRVKVTKRLAKRLPATVRLSAPDLLRVLSADLSWREAVAEGRLLVDGDVDHFNRLVGLEEIAANEPYGKSSRSTVLERYRRNADAFEALIASTPPDRWDDPSPCEGWTARDIVAHVVKLTRTTPREGGPKPTAATKRKDPLAAFRLARAEFEGVLADAAVSEARIGFLDAAVSFDLPQHWWDLAKATGQDATMDPDYVQTAWDSLAPMDAGFWHWQRQTIKAYGPPIPVPDDASLQDRLLGLLGRDPAWQPPKS